MLEHVPKRKYATRTSLKASIKVRENEGLLHVGSTPDRPSAGCPRRTNNRGHFCLKYMYELQSAKRHYRLTNHIRLDHVNTNTSQTTSYEHRPGSVCVLLQGPHFMSIPLPGTIFAPAATHSEAGVGYTKFDDTSWAKKSSWSPQLLDDPSAGLKQINKKKTDFTLLFTLIQRDEEKLAQFEHSRSSAARTALQPGARVPEPARRSGRGARGAGLGGGLRATAAARGRS